VKSKPVPREGVLVVNARSRKGERLFHEARAKLEEAGIRLLAAHAIRDPAKLIPTVTDAVRSGAPMVIVGGGDGSLSCSVDEVVGYDCVFALLPLGTANSFARSLNIPLDLDGAIRVIAEGERRRIDLGRINGDYFANAASLGLSPMIGETVPHKLKRYLGRFGYLLWALWCLLRFSPFRLCVSDGETREWTWATEVRVLNGRFHSGVEFLEEETLDGGELVVQAVTGKSLARLMWDWLARFLKLPGRNGAAQEFRGIRFLIETRPRLKVSVDGEVLTRTPALVECVPNAIEVVVPARSQL